MQNQPLHVIVGLGDTGLSCAHFLRYQSIPFAMMDTRLNPPGLADFKKYYPDVSLCIGELDDGILSQAATIVLSPGLSLRDIHFIRAQAKGISIIGDIELFARTVKVPVIAITGTNAKSTVTTIVGLMAKEAGYRVAVGGNLGIPVLNLYLQDPNAELYVLELSSFQLETTYQLNTKVATVLNVTPDHMDRYNNMSDYVQAKHRVYDHATSVVCNLDDPYTFCNKLDVTCYGFTMHVPEENQFGIRKIAGEGFLALGQQALMPVSALPVKGKHYEANALASLALGFAYGFPMEAMLKVLREFKGLPHRCQWVREQEGVDWYNDSKGTNVGATKAAIEGLGKDMQGKLILIAGGVGKNADFSPLQSAVKSYCRHIILIGEAAETLAEALGKDMPSTYATSMEEAVRLAKSVAFPGDAVLLSPACASFDMFKNYAHRGEVFTEAVLRL